MRSRKEISDMLKNENKGLFNKHSMLLELTKIEILLDIRDQNEMIITQLNALKQYSVNSSDINISKLWDEGDKLK